MDWDKLNKENMAGRRASVEVMITGRAVDSDGNIAIEVRCGAGREVIALGAMIHTSAFTSVGERAITIGDFIRWKPDETGVLRTKGEVLWRDEKYALIRWDNYDEPEIAPLDAVELTNG